jgi:hypothetical protein
MQKIKWLFETKCIRFRYAELLEIIYFFLVLDPFLWILISIIL